MLYAAVNTPALPPGAKRPGIPPELDRIVVKTLAKSPEDLYLSMEALRDDLEMLEASGAISEDGSSPLIRPRPQTLAPTTSLDPATFGRLRSPLRNRRRAIVGGAIVILSLAAGGLFWFARRLAPSAGELDRMHGEEEVIRKAMDFNALDGILSCAGIIGDKKRFVEIRREIFRSGVIESSDENVRAIYADPNIEDYPGDEEIAAEKAVEIKRLEALY